MWKTENSDRRAYIVLDHSSNVFKVQMFGGLKCHLWTLLERISCYVSTFRTKRCVDVAERDSCRLQQCDYYSRLFYSVLAKTTISNFRQVGTWPLSLAIPPSQDHFARRWLLWLDFFHEEIFELVEESNNQVLMSYRLLCVIGSEMNRPIRLT